MTTPDQEREALAWLEEAEIGGPACRAEDERARATIKALLSRPTLPAEPSEALVNAIWRIICDSMGSPRGHAEQILAAIRAELSRPKTKTVEVWHLEYAVLINGDWKARTYGGSKTDVDEQAAKSLTDASMRCIRVTGPHTQEIPG